MSRDKIEIKYSGDTSKEEKENEKQTGFRLKEEHNDPITITTSNGSRYTEKMLLSRIDETGLLDDYIGGSKVRDRSSLWVAHFSREDLIQIFTTFPSVYHRCHAQMSKTLGPAVTSVPWFNDAFCSLFENVLEKAKNIHLRSHWGFSENTAEFNEFELAISLLYTFLDEDYKTSSRLVSALNKFADSPFVNLKNIGLSSIYSQLYQISRHRRCSAGFAEELSRVYTAMTVARAVLFYGNVLQKQPLENSSEHRDASNLWDYRQAAGFFKMGSELKKEMESPLYHGNINTDTAKDLLRNPGDYLARYSSNQNNYYFTVLLHNPGIMYGKVVLNLMIPKDKLESWIKEPTENREEIEGFIKEQLSPKKHSKNLPPFLDKFFANEHYSPVFNPVSDADMHKAAFRVG